MEVGGVLRNAGEGIVNLIIDGGLLFGEVLQGDAAAAAKGHRSVARD